MTRSENSSCAATQEAGLKRKPTIKLSVHSLLFIQSQFPALPLPVFLSLSLSLFPSPFPYSFLSYPTTKESTKRSISPHDTFLYRNESNRKCQENERTNTRGEESSLLFLQLPFSFNVLTQRLQLSLPVFC